ncbi:cysteine hydrolase [Solwaraspora sp. WMMD406]|uniref:isochorismatase family cysteine hydrolase n=1 Tax=Solwaraspora sp. WMMD406 TaxID=3016095 RepID=UPI002417D017|nr:isochorismatase family cysteine hydrolase [Solwaraspora sp. WMMD406]MDG4764370.1 cysteine hydrolase [Solwaraspora sp. WMMD406]
MTYNQVHPKSHAVEVIDRSETLARMNDALEIDFTKTAVVQIDMHVRQIDKDWSSFPQNVADRILPNAAAFLDAGRELGLPVIHVMVYQRLVERGMQPRTSIVQSTGRPGTPYGLAPKPGYHPDAPEGYFEWDVMPILGPKKGDYIINTKRQMTSSFLSTDVEHLIRCLGVDTFFVVGINTNNCVSNFSFDAYNRMWTPIIVTDAVGSTHGKDLHEFALQNYARTIGFAMSSDEAVERLSAAKAAAGVPPMASA